MAISTCYLINVLIIDWAWYLTILNVCFINELQYADLGPGLAVPLLSLLSY